MLRITLVALTITLSHAGVAETILVSTQDEYEDAVEELRPGDGAVVEGNVFLGNRVDGTGGIRVINADQVVLNNVEEPALAEGFVNASVELAPADNGLLYPAGEQFADMGASRDLKVLDREGTGVSWYPKPGPEMRFDTGETASVGPGEDSLFHAADGAGGSRDGCREAATAVGMAISGCAPSLVAGARSEGES